MGSRFRLLVAPVVDPEKRGPVYLGEQVVGLLRPGESRWAGLAAQAESQAGVRSFPGRTPALVLPGLLGWSSVSEEVDLPNLIPSSPLLACERAGCGALRQFFVRESDAIQDCLPALVEFPIGEFLYMWHGAASLHPCCSHT
jgi:hypothetical protein